MRSGFAIGMLLSTIAFATAATAQEPTIFLPFAQVSAEEAAIEITPSGDSRAAAGLTQNAGCSETKLRTAEVFLAWIPAPAGLAQRVDISKFREGFSTGDYETSGPLPSTRKAVAIEGSEPGVHYYWRVLTATGGVWVSSAPSRFEVPTCASDLTILPEGRQGGTS